VQIAGKWYTVAGRVAMDQFVVDLGGDTPAIGEEVLGFGNGDRGEPTAEDWARAAGTISYEIVTRIGARVPRRYLGGSHPWVPSA
jgi:alanine racemase